MKILLTGASSFIGFHIANYLAKSGFEIIGTYRTENSNIANLRKLANITLCHVDMALEKSFSLLPKKIDVIVHVAAVSEGSGVTIDDLISCNVNGTKNLVNYAHKIGIKKLIYTSSLSIYGKIEKNTVDENTSLNNPGLYGTTKYLGECLLSKCDRNFASIAIRLPGVLGNGAHRAWIPSLCELAEAGKDLSIYNPNAPFNNAIHVDDLAEFVGSLVNRDFAGFHAFPVGASGEIAVHEICKRILIAKNSRSTIQIVPSPQSGFTVSSRYAIQEFGYAPKDINRILQAYLSEINQRHKI